MKSSVNLVPRALFPCFGAREKRPGDEVEVRCLNQSGCKVAEKAKFPAGPGEKNGRAVPN